jgi:hypothetical protein
VCWWLTKDLQICGGLLIWHSSKWTLRQALPPRVQEPPKEEGPEEFDLWDAYVRAPASHGPAPPQQPCTAPAALSTLTALHCSVPSPRHAPWTGGPRAAPCPPLQGQQFKDAIFPELDKDSDGIWCGALLQGSGPLLTKHLSKEL